jgi:hypothetical protein
MRRKEERERERKKLEEMQERETGPVLTPGPEGNVGVGRKRKESCKRNRDDSPADVAQDRRGRTKRKKEIRGYHRIFG